MTRQAHLRVLLTGVAVLAVGATVQASTLIYNVDMGNLLPAYAGQGLLGGVSDTTWTKADANVTNLSLPTSTGGPSSVTLTNTGFDGSYQHPNYNNYNGWTNFGDFSFFSSVGSATMTISGLNSGDAYTFLLYGQGESNYSVTASINGGAAIATTGGLNWWGSGWHPAPANPSNYLQLTGAVPGNGQLVVNLTPGPAGSYAVVNGFQLQTTATIPEPASLGLGLLGLGIIALGRRRMTRQSV